MIVGRSGFFYRFVGKRGKVTLLAALFVPFTSFFPLATSIVPKPVDKQPGVKRIVIDPGHGGKDSGCLGASAKEKEVALAIGLKLGKFIEDNYKDVEVIYTRKTDVFVELHERANIANKAEADLFICIHANSGPEKAHGTETYVMGLHKTEANLKVAKRENSAILLEDNYKVEYGGFDPKSAESYITFALHQSAHLDQSARFAQHIQDEFVKLGRRDRGVKQAGFLVLYRTTMPSVLIETGFLTNKEEEKFLASPKNQESMASSIYKAFEVYKKETEALLAAEGVSKKDAPKAPAKPGRSLYGSTTEKPTTEKDAPAAPPKNSEKRAEKRTDPHAVAHSTGIEYRVQLASSSKKLAIKAKNFNGLENVKYIAKDGVFRYYYGQAGSLEAIEPFKKEARAKGYTDAFVVVFKDGKRIKLTEALELEKK